MLCDDAYHPSQSNNNDYVGTGLNFYDIHVYSDNGADLIPASDLGLDGPGILGEFREITSPSKFPRNCSELRMEWGILLDAEKPAPHHCPKCGSILPRSAECVFAIQLRRAARGGVHHLPEFQRLGHCFDALKCGRFV
ncbi:hypothetical protein FIBSPDRAFT_862152 [Athelia psychrophila]|uniref:Uncharacterized protein n=1 Tax=Athelia psychrophila TaxID=1759441 RepID=A0A166IKZ7_9AGAM|nr:hypothetical protein FIBSPDRAFT_862152 [Fibularhizoctonia sp. CBS 109695]